MKHVWPFAAAAAAKSLQSGLSASSKYNTGMHDTACVF